MRSARTPSGERWISLSEKKEVNRRRLLRKLQPFVAVVAVVATSGMLVLAMHFTELDLQWITFLSGVLAASLLAMVARATRAEYSAARRLARVSILQEKLGREKRRWQEMDTAFSTLKERLRYSDEALPLMMAYVDRQARYRYHNRALREWLGLRTENIDGRHMREVHGRKGFAQIEAAVAKALEGEPVQFEWTQKTPGGPFYRLACQYHPHFGDKKDVVGFYAILSDVTERADVERAAQPAARPGAASQIDGGAAGGEASAGASPTPPALDSFLPEATGSKHGIDRSRIAAAIKKGEFSLFHQPIRSLAPAARLPEHHEIFVRLLEEEENLIPPGAFFPLAQEYGLLPQLDRWVFEHLLQWIAARRSLPSPGHGLFFVNIATDTICDADFPEFVEHHLRKSGVRGDAVCFEITETAFSSRRAEVERFAQLVKQSSCRTALSGFGREGISVELLKACPLDFLKIHGSLVLGIQRNPADLGKVTAISRIAKVIGVSTVAEMVESQDTIAKLREAKVDFAQGFGIAKPEPLAKLAA